MGNFGPINGACSGFFYDDGGPNGQYSNNQLLTATFCAPPGESIIFTFTDFRLEGGFDFLDVYAGPSTASPLIGSYTGNLSPGVIASPSGGCLTFQFISDGITRRRGWEATISCGTAPPPANTGDTCPEALAFCTGTTYTFPNNFNQPNLGTINCLLSSPNPIWYYMQIENPGDLNINIAQFDLSGVPIDIDFNVWGPFTTYEDGCLQIANSTAPNVDCSFSGSAFEQASIPNAQTGEFYILLLTNFENIQGDITFNSASNSTATTNCDILCSISSLSATASTCDAISNTYTVNGDITVLNPPEDGILTVSSSCGATTTFSAPFPNQINYTLAGLNSNGLACTVTASFSSDASCSLTQSYTAPASCASLSLNCPTYSNISTSPSTACSNQTYYLEVENTSCNGQIYMNVVGNYGTWPDEIYWELRSVLTGAIIQNGIFAIDGLSFNYLIGPLNPNVVGTVFELYVDDFPFSDGFSGGGFIQVQQGSNIIGGPISGNFGSSTSLIFAANVSISPATITINTPAGPVVQTVEYCRDFRVPISINNTNYCNTINVNLPWTIICNTNGSVLSSGSNNVTVYPSLPNASNDVVIIDFNTSTCEWDVSPNNDCDQADIGSVFSISPDPSSITNPTCITGTHDFDVNYLGLSGGPGCCATGGSLIPVEQNQTFSTTDFQVASSPFGGINNAAYLQIPANGIGGNATSLDLQFDLTSFCFNPPGATASDFWVTLYVDGNVISDINIAAGSTSYSINVALGNIPGGFTSASTFEIYIYPNAFNAGATNTQYNPSANCASLGDGVWKANFSTSLNVSYSEFSPSPADCVFQTTASFQCCEPVPISNVEQTICSGAAFGLQNWIDAVNAANPCAVFSSVLPVAAVTAPDNVLPNGINPTSSTITQNVSAYAYCDVNGNGAVGIGDTYTLISTYELEIAPNLSAGSNASTTICSGGSSINLFSLLGGTPSSSGVWSGPSLLSGAELGTFNPTSNLGGLYTYTVAGISSCPDAAATVNVILEAESNAYIIYPGSPYCKNLTVPQAPSISGTSGGSFSSAPAGLSINASTGAIVPSTSAAGTYTITYSIPAAGACPAFSATTSIVINNIPPIPSLLPDPICAGSATTITAGNGSWYEFFINGVSQEFPSATSTLNWTMPASGDQICVHSYPPPPFTFDGNIIETEWSNPLSTSAGGASSAFGANYLDALYLQNSGGYLYGAIAGQTENNSNNRILLFIDCASGGYNNLGAWSPRTNAPYVSVENLNGLITFDPGFNPDFIVCMNQASGIAYFDLYDMQNDINYYLGSDITAGLISNNLLGYQANGGPPNYTQGFEFAIPLSLLGDPSGTIQTFCMLVNDPGLGNPAATYVSNQFLTPANVGESNYADGFIDFGAAAPDPISFSLSADCYSQNCITVSPSVTPNTVFTYTPTVCEEDPDVSPTLASGFTLGGSFSSSSGLVINSSTGQIDVSASTPGDYTINYSVPAIGCNPAASGTFDITIYPTPSTTPIYHE